MFYDISMNEFYEKSYEFDHIAIWGSGNYCHEMLDTMGSEICKKISLIIDNDKNKQGKKVYAYTSEIEIVSFYSFCQKSLKLSKCCILICVHHYSSIIEQIESSNIASLLPVFCYKSMKAKFIENEVLCKKLPLNMKRTTDRVIPKTIHYCWFGKNQIPSKNLEYIESWKKYCPDFQIIRWDESNYDVTKNAYMYEAYKNKKWAFVADYARLDILLQNGGIYLDTDVELVDSLEELLFQPAFSCFEGITAVNSGLGMGCKKGEKIIKDLLDCYEKRDFYKEDGTLNLTTCVVIQTDCLAKKGLILNGEYQVIEGMTIYPEKVLTGKNYYTGNIILLPYTKAIHHYEGSWI